MAGTSRVATALIQVNGLATPDEIQFSLSIVCSAVKPEREGGLRHFLIQTWNDFCTLLQISVWFVSAWNS